MAGYGAGDDVCAVVVAVVLTKSFNKFEIKLLSHLNWFSVSLSELWACDVAIVVVAVAFACASVIIGSTSFTTPPLQFWFVELDADNGEKDSSNSGFDSTVD